MRVSHIVHLISLSTPSSISELDTPPAEVRVGDGAADDWRQSWSRLCRRLLDAQDRAAEGADHDGKGVDDDGRRPRLWLVQVG